MGSSIPALFTGDARANHADYRNVVITSAKPFTVMDS